MTTATTNGMANGQPLVARIDQLSSIEEPHTLKKLAIRTIFKLLLNTLSLPMMTVFFVKRGRGVMQHLWSLAQQPAIDYNNVGKSNLVQKALELPSAQVYLNENALEYQIAEGYCSVATQRNLLKSIPDFSSDKVPCPKKGGPSTMGDFAKSLLDISGFPSTVVYGSDGYEAFLQGLHQANDASTYRVAVNFLRSSMFGVMRPKWLPSSWVLAFCGGHFSPVLGFLEKEKLVAIFDTNHKYGFYLVDAKRLYDAVNTVDVMNGSTRGLVVLDITTTSSSKEE